MATHFQRAGEQVKIGLFWILWTGELRKNILGSWGERTFLLSELEIDVL